MTIRARHLEGVYLGTVAYLMKTTPKTKDKIGTKALAAYTRALIEECPQMNSRACEELSKIADELDNL